MLVRAHVRISPISHESSKAVFLLDVQLNLIFWVSVDVVRQSLAVVLSLVVFGRASKRDGYMLVRSVLVAQAARQPAKVYREEMELQ